MNNSGLVTTPSNHPVGETIRRLEAALAAKGLTLFARIDHAAGAAAAGMALRPTELLIFGNARGGTPLMQERQLAGIDLPLKVLVWEDAAGKTQFTYNAPAWIAQRHGLAGQSTIGAMTILLEALTRDATGS